MLALTKLDADFSRECAGQRIGHLLFATHPRPAIREWLYASIVSDHSHRSESLFTALALVPWQEVQSSEIDLFCLLSLGLCRIVDREFRELLY
jgi:hypothetical protein